MLLRRFVPAGSIDTQVVDGLLHDCILRLLEGDEKDKIAKYQMVREEYTSLSLVLFVALTASNALVFDEIDFPSIASRYSISRATSFLR